MTSPPDGAGGKRARAGRRAALWLVKNETKPLAIETLTTDTTLLDLVSGTLAEGSSRGSRKGGSLMMKQKLLAEAYQKLIAGADLPLEEESAVINQIARTDPPSLASLCLLIANQRRALRAEATKAEAARGEAEQALELLREPPWYPADVLRVYKNGRLDVAVGGRRKVVISGPELVSQDLHAGAEVFLDRDLSVALTLNAEPCRSGVVGTVAEIGDGHVVLRGVGDEELVALCAPELLASLRAGDRVLYKRDAQCVFARLAERTQSPYLLEKPPGVQFADIGGLDHVIADLRRDLDLHLLHPEVAAMYGLRLMRGLTLVGPPGTGKSMLAAATAHYLAGARSDTRFLDVKPGALRGMYYGETEARIRELFATARRAPGLVVIFFDELDTFGARGAGIAQQIDDRVMGALLAEIDGLEASDHILCIGATNRLDLCDEALVRQGRFTDRIYQIPRPGREATRQIFARYVTPDLPYGADGDQALDAAMVIEAAVGHLYAERGGAEPIATVTLADGTRHAVAAPAVLSGALIASAVERAKHVAAQRHLDGAGGLTVEDVLAALDHALSAEADKIRSPHAARRILDFPGADDIVRVTLPAHRRPRRYRYLRAA